VRSIYAPIEDRSSFWPEVRWNLLGGPLSQTVTLERSEESHVAWVGPPLRLQTFRLSGDVRFFTGSRMTASEWERSINVRLRRSSFAPPKRPLELAWRTTLPNCHSRAKRRVPRGLGGLTPANAHPSSSYQPSLRSSQSGFMASIKAIFLTRSRPLIFFSRDMASRGLAQLS